MSPGFQRAARLSEIPSDLPLGVALPDGTRVCLVRDGRQVYAMADRCPHRDFALSSGEMVAPCILECSWHGAQFDVRTGRMLQGPATDDLMLLAVRLAGDEVFVGPRAPSSP
jgi:3-phenylpropionate/trans-cinnamate dioxygenase ferredoxin subunit